MTGRLDFKTRLGMIMMKVDNIFNELEYHSLHEPKILKEFWPNYYNYDIRNYNNQFIKLKCVSVYFGINQYNQENTLIEIEYENIPSDLSIEKYLQKELKSEGLKNIIIKFLKKDY